MGNTKYLVINAVYVDLSSMRKSIGSKLLRWARGYADSQRMTSWAHIPKAAGQNLSSLRLRDRFQLSIWTISCLPRNVYNWVYGAGGKVGITVELIESGELPGSEEP